MENCIAFSTEYFVLVLTASLIIITGEGPKFIGRIPSINYILLNKEGIKKDSKHPFPAMFKSAKGVSSEKILRMTSPPGNDLHQPGLKD